jgi:cupin 2 domain-containing protein
MSICSVSMRFRNLYQALPSELPQELTEVLAGRPGLRIERIVSRGQASPPGFWYDQEEWEWVLVLAGRARLRFEETDEVAELGAGDYLEIPPRCRHRVDWTDPSRNTIWLAIFCAAGFGSGNAAQPPEAPRLSVDPQKTPKLGSDA